MACPEGIAQALLSDGSPKLLRPFLARELFDNPAVVFLRYGEGVTNGSSVGLGGSRMAAAQLTVRGFALRRCVTSVLGNRMVAGDVVLFVLCR